MFDDNDGTLSDFADKHMPSGTQAFDGVTRMGMFDESRKFPTEMNAQLSEMPFLFEKSYMPIQQLEEFTGNQHRGTSNSYDTLNHIISSDQHNSAIIKPGIGLHQNPIGNDASMNSDPYSSLQEDQSLISMSESRGFFGEDEAFLASSGGILPITMPAFNSSHVSCFDQQNPPYDDERARGSSETKARKRCNCKKTECLKLYCECFRNGYFCRDSCACETCYNTPEYEDIVGLARDRALSRNALAFSPKIINQFADPPVYAVEERSNAGGASSSRHKIGCNCKKSKCLKKYCECYQVDVGCSDGCRCEDCNNPYGKKPELRQGGRWKRRILESVDTAQPSEDISHMTPLDKSLAEVGLSMK